MLEIESFRYEETKLSHLFAETVQLQPDWSIAWNNLGNLRHMRNDWDGAEAAWTRAYQTDPGNAAAIYNLALAAARKGDQRKASMYRAKYNQLTNKTGRVD